MTSPKMADSRLMVLTELLINFSGACAAHYGWRFDDAVIDQRHGVQGKDVRHMIEEFAKLLTFGAEFDNAATKATIKRYLADKPPFFRDEASRIINYQRQYGSK